MVDERSATERGRYLARDTQLRKPEAMAVAYSELGYSVSGIAKHVDASESTIQSYLERAIALYGFGIAETLLDPENPPSYERVESGYHQSLETEDEQEEWAQIVDRHQEKLPQEWVHEVLEEMKDDDLLSVSVE